MGLPTPKMPLPGFRLIADNAGSYIDDVNNIRLGPEFVLSRNIADPSAAISVSEYVNSQIASALLAAKGPVPIASGDLTTGVISIPFTANQYAKIDVYVDYDSYGFASIAMTGLSNGTYDYQFDYATGSTLAAGAQTGLNNWPVATSSGANSRGSSRMEFIIPPAPRHKQMYLWQMDKVGGGANAMIRRLYSAHSTDVIHDPTAIVITMTTSGASPAGGWRAIGYPS